MSGSMYQSGLEDLKLNYLLIVSNQHRGISLLYQSILDADKGVCTFGDPNDCQFEPLPDSHFAWLERLRKVYQRKEEDQVDCEYV